MGIFDNDEKKYHDRAGDYFKKGDFEKALEYLDKVLEINHNSANALNDKAFTLKNMGSFDEALRYYDKVLELEPNHVMTLLNKANILMDNIKNYEEAVKYYNILLKMDEKVFKEKIEYSDLKYHDIFLHIWNEKGLALFNLKRYEEAIYCYNESLEMDSNNVDALHGKKLAENELNNIRNSTYPNCNVQVNNGMNFCPECGTKSINSAKFCYNCGANLIHDNVVEDINRQTYGNENVNHQHTEYDEEMLNRINEPKKFKHPLIPLLDRISNVSFYIFTVVSIVSVPLAFFILFIDPQSFNIIVYGSLISFVIFLVIAVVSSIVSYRLKIRIKQKIRQNGIPAQACILEVENLERDYHNGRRTAELTLEVDPETDAPYRVKSTVNVGVNDAALIYRPGRIVKVLIDPKDASHVEVEY